MQPGDDHSSDGTLCYVTGPLAGSSAGTYDVDGGPSHLISPMFDLEDSDAVVSYWRWYHISTEWDDALVVAVSNNGGGNWETVETVSNRETWTYAEWKVSDYVTPTNQVQVRFTVDDSPNNSLVEALIDDFAMVVLAECPYAPGDLNCDGAVDNFDIAAFVLVLTSTPPDHPEYYALYPDCDHTLADINDDGSVDNFDIAPFVGLLTGP